MTGKSSLIKTVFLLSLVISLIVITVDGKAAFASEESDQKNTEPKLDTAPAPPVAPVGEDKSGVNLDIPIGLDLDMEVHFISIGEPDNRASRAARVGAIVHPDALQVEGLKTDRFGLVNWVEIVRDGKIAPRVSAGSETGSNRFEDWPILFENSAGFDVLFPHDIHTYWLDCRSCHDRIFKAKYRTNAISMKEIAEGKWCGKCHGVVAFPIEECPRCHLKITSEQ